MLYRCFAVLNQNWIAISVAGTQSKRKMSMFLAVLLLLSEGIHGDFGLIDCGGMFPMVCGLRAYGQTNATDRRNAVCMA